MTVKENISRARLKPAGQEEVLWNGFVLFYGIPTIIGYLMPNPFHTCIYLIYMIYKYIFGW